MGSFTSRHFVPRLALCLAWISVPSLFSQTAPTGQANRALTLPATQPTDELPRRIFGIIPNYRSHPSLKDSKPLTAGGKFKLAARDSFDPGTFILAGAIAGIAQASNSSPSYGQGMAGYGRYYGSSYGDLMIGNFMTTGVYPSLLHQDPRYFRRGTGSTWSRLRYAVGHTIITHGDNRRTQYNYSEFAGNATAFAISQAYDPDNRTARDAAAQFGLQIGLDMAGNVLKEFAPDLSRKFHGKKNAPATAHPVK